MKNLRYCFAFAGLLLFCMVVGTGFYISGDQDTPERKFQEREIVKVEIIVENGEIVLRPNTVEAFHLQRIIWFCKDPKVQDFMIFLGGNSPIGELEIRQKEVRIHTDVAPKKGEKEVMKRVWHNPRAAGGKLAKYYVAVYYDDDPSDSTPGKILMKDPEIIIPPRR